MKKKNMNKVLSLALAAVMTSSLVAGCGSQASTGSNESTGSAAGTEVAADNGEKEVTLTLGIWPEDTLTDDIEMHEGFVEQMKEKDPNVTCVPAYYKYATDTALPFLKHGLLNHRN